ncbi:U3 small nucleolar ribonucleoprotein MPP10 [Caligus rogercresseyi]|uniref:U3 small nucleolar ribonucleoprotein protein MPP10 n=1 Tax=Caligus rogercresseyi TaxID=217165 RepID=A0A7T8K832_CALRO|nr:U3 small nucleolar ribonucleoprotein MPP10 [Caligus rogercresseyi]
MEDLLDGTLSTFDGITKKPSRFLKKDGALFSELKTSVKALYDGVKIFEREFEKSEDSATLDSLIVDEFDEEQIWAGIQLQNGSRLQRWVKEIEGIKLGLQLGKKSDFLLGDGDDPRKKRKAPKDFGMSSEEDDDFLEEENGLIGITKKDHPKKDDDGIDPDEEGPELEDEEEEEEEKNDSEENETQDDNEVSEEAKIFQDPDFQNMSDSDGDDLPLFEDAETEEEDTDDDSAEETEAEKKTREIDAQANAYLANAMANIKNRTTEVDDPFFKMSEMEQFLEMEDKRFSDQKSGKYSEEGEPLDLFEDQGDALKEDNQIMYSDYFQNESSSTQKNNENEKQKETKSSSKKRDQDESEKKPLNIFEYDDDDSSENDEAIKSSHELRQERLQKKIKGLEKEAIGEKNWQMTGEITGTNRPENSLLQEHLDFDTVSKQAPIITEEVSKTLEQLIIQRIKDKSWDDVERKVKPLKDPYEYKKKLVLDQEKANYLWRKFMSRNIYSNKKVSLLDKDDLEIPKEIEDIQKNMHSLFAKLDVLTHYHYIPKSLSAEVKVIKNKSTLEMEEIAPVGVSEDTLLAPQEIADKSKGGPEIGANERSDTDRKRERRKKKRIQKLKAERQEKIDKALKTLKDAEKRAKMSRAFFDKLQNEVKNGINAQASKSKNKKDKKKSSSFKL